MVKKYDVIHLFLLVDDFATFLL